MTNVKLKYSILGLFLASLCLISFSCFYKVDNLAIGNIITVNDNQLIQISKKENVDIYNGAKFNFYYNNKNLNFKVSSFYIEEGNYFITLNKYLVIENSIYNLFVKTGQDILLFYVFKNVF